MVLPPSTTPAADYLPAPPLPASQLCTVTTQTFHHLGNRAYQNKAETVFEKTWLQASGPGHVFRLLIHHFSQTDNSGLNRLDEAMNRLKHELVVETDATGRLHRVLNKPQLRARFAELRPGMVRDYADAPFITPGIINNLGLVLEGDGYLEDVLNAGPEYHLLFPGLYGRAYSAAPAPLPPYLVPRIFANVDLPLRLAGTRTATVPADVAYGVFVTGQLDGLVFKIF